MSIWYPASGVTYDQYLLANSFVKDITGQIKISSSNIETKVSQQTKELIASNQQLAYVFGEGFNSLTDKLEWGLNQLDETLQDVSNSIESLHSDFNYNIALLIEEVRISNQLFCDLISKLDAIHKTLESPILTQAREFYNIGCERLSKGLLDKALEAFLEAEKKNDTDFFIQFQIGKLFLYGVDEDDNILNLEEAKRHLLLAARYAKAEIITDPKFAKFAAEALLHASISIYAKLGENEVKDDSDKINMLLQEAKKLSSDAIKICQEIPESFYHLAKYAALLNDSELSIQNLETAIATDRNYAIKADIDHAFDPIRPYVHNLLSKLKESKNIECQNKLNLVLRLWQETAAWHPETRSKLSEQYSKYSEDLKRAQDYFNSQTYFGFLDCISLLLPLIDELPSLKTKCINEYRDQINSLIGQAKNKLPRKGSYSLEVENDIDEVNSLINDSEIKLAKESYESFCSALSLAKSAYDKSSDVQKNAFEEDEEERRQEKERKLNRQRQERKNLASAEYAKTGAWILGIIGGFSGCVSCLGKGDFNLFGGAILGIAAGALLGALLGQIKS